METRSAKRKKMAQIVENDAKPIVTVNGRFLGPTVYVREGEILRCSNSLASFRFLWFFHKRKCLLLREKVSGAMDELELGWPWSLEYWK